jgi:predicted O-methyltransferase YrrM
MNQFVKSIIEQGIVYDEHNQVHKLHSHTRLEQGLFLQDILNELKPQTSIEIGLAYGISTLFICEALKELGDGKLIVMDPFQRDWKYIGLKNIKESGNSNIVEFHEDFSDKVLPKLYFKGINIQFAYIDSTKVFDVLMVDLYYLTKILDIGGIIVFDDCQFPGIKKLCRFLMAHPSFKKYRTYKKVVENRNRLRLSNIAKLIPYKNKIFSQDILHTDTELGLNYHCISFKKTSDDNRDWKWHELF